MRDHISIERRFSEPSEERLSDFNHQWLLSPYYRSHTYGWEDILLMQRVVILGEGKCGKTHEFKLQLEQLRSQGHEAFFLPLEQLHDNAIEDVLSSADETKLKSWLSGITDKPAWFFLDAVDELKLRDGSFRAALRKLQRTLSSKASFAHIFISCRPADWSHQIDLNELTSIFPLDHGEKHEVKCDEPDQIFLKTLTSSDSPAQAGTKKNEQTSGKDELAKTLVLLPLLPEQAIEFATRVNPSIVAGLREQIERTESWALFQTPSDILDGIAHIQASGQLGSLEEQKNSGINIKLTERPGRPGHVALSHDRAREGAERLALALMLTKRRSLLIDRAKQDSERLFVGDVLSDWPINEQKELLSRSLFDPSGVNAVRFHHRSTQEFLAAQRLLGKLKRGMPIRELKQLLFAEMWGEKVVFPHMEPVAAWLALWNQDILVEVRARKPEVLFRQGLPSSMPIDLRRDLLASFVKSYAGSDWRGIGIDHNDVKRLGHADLASTVRELWGAAYVGYDTRELLLELILHTPIPDCLDLAFATAFDKTISEDHRITACRAILLLGPQILKRSIGDALLSGDFSERLIRFLIPEVVPDGLSTTELITLAKTTPEIPHTVHGLGYSLYLVMHQVALPVEQVRELRSAYTAEILESRKENSRVYRAHSAFDHFTDAVLAGCARDQNLNSLEEIRAWASDAAIGLHFGERHQSIIAKEDAEQIALRISADMALRETYYWASLDLAIVLEEKSDGWSRYRYADCNNTLGGMTESDLPWLFKALSDKSRPERREVAFFAIMMLWRERRDEGVAKKVRELITDLPDIHRDFENFINPPPQKKSDECNTESKRRREKRERKEAARIKNWKEWRNDAQARPAEAFSESKRSNTLTNFFTWLDMAAHGNTSWGRWSSEIVGNVFSEDFIKHLLPALSHYWRQATPQTWSEKPKDKKHLTLNSVIHALSAIKSEAETPGWANKLSKAEAELAAKLSMIELNGFAAYLGSLEEAHQSVVHAVILRELETQVKDLGFAGQSPLLHDLYYHGSDMLKSAAANRLLVLLATWPTSMLPGTQDALRYATDLIAGHADRGAREALTSIFEKKIKSSKRFGTEHQHWLHAFAEVSPGAGCRRLLADTQDTTDQEAVRFGMCVIGGLFGDRHHAGKRPDFTELEINERAELLATLVRRIYEVAHPSTDIRHQGCYSPGTRDFAEEARRFLFDNLTKVECVETYKALGEFSELKTFEHMKSRLLQMRSELAANASEPDAMQTPHLILFEKENVIIPTDNRSMHQTMLNRLDDYEHFILESEFSNKSTLQLVDEETELRRNIANWLNDHSRSIYRVNQEAVKVHEKRTDIRLNSVTIDVESVIELKLDDKKSRWSGADLEYALREQLVGRYLSHERCRSGCLLLVMREKRQWEHPKTKERMSLQETISWLQSIADTIVAEKTHLCLSVKGIDLT